MKISLKLIDNKTGKDVTDFEQVMVDSNLQPYLKFEDIGLQSDGSPVIFSKCGEFGYIPTDKYTLVLTYNKDNIHKFPIS